MKCRSCDYNDYDPIPEWDKILEKFIKLRIDTESFEDAKSKMNYELYACPKCGTVKIENEQILCL